MELIDLKEDEGFYANCSLKGYLLNNAYIHRRGDKIYVFSDEKALNGGHNYKFSESRFKELKKKYIWSIGDVDNKTFYESYHSFKLIPEDIYELWG